MPAKIITLNNVPDQNKVPVRYQDNNDGTYSQSVSVSAGDVHIGAVGGQGAFTTNTFSRPANVTPYSVHDVVGPAVNGLLTFDNIARANGLPFYIVKARLMTNLSTCAAIFRLHLFKDNTPTAIVDNLQYTLLWANRLSRVGFIDFDMTFTEGSGSDSAIALLRDLRLHIVPLVTSRTIYGMLVTKSVFTPTSGQSFFISLNVEQD